MFTLRTVWLLGVFSLACVNAASAQPLQGTQPLEIEGDLAERLVAGVDKFLLREIEQSVAGRATHWKRDFTSPAAYNTSVAANRERLKKYIGAVDARVPFTAPALIASTNESAVVGRGENYEILAVRWPVLAGVDAEGLLLRPTGRASLADVVALHDADNTPEMLCGLVPGVRPESQFARRLAESGCRVLVPLLMDRADTHSVVRNSRATNQPHREFLYRGAFEMGRHLIGYEVQKVLAAVDWFASEAGSNDRSIGVIGYGEGGLLALYAGALDPRIDVTLTSGYFDSRQGLWQEPIYRNVWALLTEFGDAELASLVAPRALVIEACAVPAISGPPKPHDGRSGAAPGQLTTPTVAVVEQELARARALTQGLNPPTKLELVVSGEGNGPAGSPKALEAFLNALSGIKLAAGGTPEKLWKQEPDFAGRFQRQYQQLDEFNQSLMRESEFTREKFWAKADKKNVESWQQTSGTYRDYFYNEVIGRFDLKPLPANPRTRKVFDEPKYTGYEVVLDLWPDVIAMGILLVPKEIREGDRRPVVVCQHGLEGRPRDVADPKIDNKAYNQYGCRLAERGFVVYAPQNLYIGQDKFRTLQRKGNVLKKSLFSVIVPQHQVSTDWLASLPFVDPERIAFYGLSYGGKTAMRVPPLVPRYCLSICSADFNEWIWKNVSNRHRYSYLGTGEYEMMEFDLGNTFNYSEMAGLIAPRPFMVERGHHDGVGPDEWVAYEFAKVRRLYVALKIPDRTTIEFFDGPHSIHGVGTFEFLHTHLKWPAPAAVGK